MTLPDFFEAHFAQCTLLTINGCTRTFCNLFIASRLREGVVYTFQNTAEMYTDIAQLFYSCLRASTGSISEALMAG